MLTAQDISKLAGILATKEDIWDINNEITGIKTSLESLTTTVDGYTKKFDILETENKAIQNKLNRHENWFHQIALKLGIKLDY